MKPSHTIIGLLAITLFCTFSNADSASKPILISAARVFDGYGLRHNAAVLIQDGVVAGIGAPVLFTKTNAERMELGDATVLPGFIELHAHLSYHRIPPETVLKHGITTLRDVGGPLLKPQGGDGRLRILSAGPILTAPLGYPIVTMGAANIAVAITSESHARQTVRELISGGAAIIKIALEPGGETGAPWHNHHHGHDDNPNVKVDHKHPQAAVQAKWPLMPLATVKAIVVEAHRHGKQVTAHVAETEGVKLALDAGVDEWAHIPCGRIPDALLQRAAQQGVKVVTTIDTLSKCPGIADNIKALAVAGVELLYGAEIAHPDIPWGIDAQELAYLMQMADKPVLEVFQSATSKAGRHLGIPLLGTLLSGAPADLIAVKGSALDNLKLLEYPDLVISGGKPVVNLFASPQTMAYPHPVAPQN